MGLSLRNIAKKISDVASGVERQINPLDHGATYTKPNVAPGPSVISQLTHPINRAVNIVQHPSQVYQAPARQISNSVAGNAVRLAAANVTANAKARQNALAKLKISENELGARARNPSTAFALASGGHDPKVTKPTVKLNGKTVDANLEKLVLGHEGPAAIKPTALGKTAEALNVNKQVRKATQLVEKGVNKGVRKSLESGYTAIRLPGRILVGVSRQAGRSPEEISRLTQYRGQKQLGDIYGKAIAKSGEAPGINSQAVHSLLDPELSKAKGVSVKPTEADVAEAGRLRAINDNIHEGNHQMGFLDDATYNANKGQYIRRDATDFFKQDNAFMHSRDSRLELNNFKKRKDLPDIPDDVVKAMNSDPHYLTALNIQQFQRNKSYLDYSNWLSKNGSISSTPKKGYVQVPDSPAYGALKGQHILKEQLEDLQGFIYETEAAQHSVALLNWYDRNPLRKARKSVLTIYNPGVRLGNRTFNYLVTSLNGINPVTFTKNYYKARKMIKANSPEYIEATKAGIFGSSIVDKELYRTAELRPSKNVAKKAHGVAAESYSRVDNEARMSSYLTFRERGLDPTEAATRTHRMLQDYDMVGHLFDLGAKTPVAGNAFVRFSSELMRLAHNTVVDNPIRAAGAAIAASTLITLASKKSGESPEDRKTREGRLGAPRVPFTNQSLEVQTPWGAINTGRLLGITTYNDLTTGGLSDADRLMPFQNPVKHDKTGFHANPAGLTADPLIGPLVGLGLNRDFRGKPILDPDAEKYPNQPLSAEQKKKNALGYLRMNYVPYANEGNSLKAAKEGKPNYYGKERSLSQASLRLAGIKVEKYGKKQAETQRGRDQYFSGEFAQDTDWKRKNPDLAQTYDKFKGREKNRDGPNKGTNYFDFVTPEKWKIMASDTSGRLYDRLKTEALGKTDGRPVDPIYNLEDKNRVREVLQIRSSPPGNEIEREEILRATSNWYSQFEKAESEYYKTGESFYGDKSLPDNRGPRAKAYSSVPHPDQPDIVKQYYQLKDKDAQGAKNFYKTNADKLSAAFGDYRQARLDEINAKRKIMGFEPISSHTYNNVTFGYEDDERKVATELYYKGKAGGYGSGGRRGSGGSSKTSSAYKYAVSLKAGGATAKPKVSVRGPAIAAAKAKAAAKPKLSLKKSRV